MALAAKISELELPRGVFRGTGTGSQAPDGSLALDLPIDAVLPGGGLPRGAVVELAAVGGAALATTLSLAACRSIQREAEQRGGEPPWCAFVDPTRSLFGPGVASAGVRLDRLLVVRPALEALARSALRIVESHAFAIAVIDTIGVPGALLDVGLGSWPRVVRRLAIAAEGSNGCVLLLTDRDARRPLPLPVAQRIELARRSESELCVRIAKDRRGRVASPRTIRWTRPEPKGDGRARLVG